MSDFDLIREGSVKGVKVLSVTAPHARRGEPVHPSHPSHSTIDINAELAERMAERLSTYCRRRQKRTDIRDQFKQARDAGLIKRHANKSRRLNP